MVRLLRFALVSLAAMGTGLCISTPTAPSAIPAEGKIAVPSVRMKDGKRRVVPAGPGKQIVMEMDGDGRESRALEPTGVPLTADQLPKLDMGAILGRAAGDLPRATVAGVAKTYAALNAGGSPGRDEGLLAAQLFALHATAADKHGECWFQAAAFHAAVARQEGNRDVLVKAIEGAFRLKIDDAAKAAESEACLNDVLALQGSAYPPALKLAACAAALPYLAPFVDNQADPGMKPDDPRRFIPRLLDAGVAQIEAMAKQGMPAPDLHDYAEALLGQTTINGGLPGATAKNLSPQSFTGGRRDRYEKLVAEALARAKAPEEVEVFLKAKYLIDLASAARGTGLADSVTDEQAREMNDSLGQARALLAEAGKKHPGNAQVPLLMMSTAFGDGMTKEALWEWFHKAIAIDPGNIGAYRVMMCYLQPQWYGSGQEMADFGVQCWKTLDWDNGIPMVLPIGMNMLAANHPGFYRTNANIKEAVEKSYRTYLTHYPESLLTRTQYLQFASKVGDWPVVKDQLAILNNYWDMTALDPWSYSEIAEEAAKH